MQMCMLRRKLELFINLTMNHFLKILIGWTWDWCGPCGPQADTAWAWLGRNLLGPRAKRAIREVLTFIIHKRIYIICSSLKITLSFKNVLINFEFLFKSFKVDFLLQIFEFKSRISGIYTVFCQFCQKY